MRRIVLVNRLCFSDGGTRGVQPRCSCAALRPQSPHTWSFGKDSAGTAEDSRKREGAVSRLSWRSASCHSHRTGATHRILEKFEPDGIPDGERIEGRACFEIAPMEKDLTTVRHADISVPLPDHELRNVAGRELHRLGCPCRSPRAMRLRQGSATSGVRAAEGRRRILRRRCVPAWDEPR